MAESEQRPRPTYGRVSGNLWLCRWPQEVNDLDWALDGLGLTRRQLAAVRRLLLALDRSNEYRPRYGRREQE